MQGGVQSHPEDVAVYGGLACHSSRFRLPGILLPGVRPNVHWSRFNAPPMGWDASLCVPPFRNAPPSDLQSPPECQHGSDFNSSLLAIWAWLPDLLDLLVEVPVFLPLRKHRLTASFALEPPRAAVNCVEATQQAAQHPGMTSVVAEQLALCRRKSTSCIYQAKWGVYRSWCRSKGHSISRPSIAKVADFLLYLRKSRSLSTSVISGYRCMLNAVFKYRLPEFRTVQSLKEELLLCPVQALKSIYLKDKEALAASALPLCIS